MQQLVDQQMRLIDAVTSNSTAASEDAARVMLAAMITGSGLVFLAAAATSIFGRAGAE